MVETLLKVCPDEGSQLFSPVFANILKSFIVQEVCTSCLQCTCHRQ